MNRFVFMRSSALFTVAVTEAANLRATRQKITQAVTGECAHRLSDVCPSSPSAAASTRETTTIMQLQLLERGQHASLKSHEKCPPACPLKQRQRKWLPRGIQKIDYS